MSFALNLRETVFVDFEFNLETVSDSLITSKSLALSSIEIFISSANLPVLLLFNTSKLIVTKSPA